MKALIKISGLMSALLFLILCFMPDFYNSFGTDYAVYAYQGYEILKGKVPYLDFFDHKFPLFFYYLALMQKVFGSSWIALKLISVITYLISAAGFVALANYLLKSPRWAMTSGLVYVFYITRLDIDGLRDGQIIVFGLFFLFLSSRCFLQVIDKLLESNSNNKEIFVASGLAGLWGGFAFLTKQTFIEPAVAATILFAGLLLLRGYPKKGVVLFAFLSLIVGYIASVLPFLGYVIYKSGYSNYYNCTIQYNIDYSKLFSFKIGIGNFGVLFKKTLLLWVAVIAYICFDFIKIIPKQKKFYYVILCLLISTVIFFVTRGLDWYYAFPFMSFLILAFVFSLRRFVEKWNRIFVSGPAPAFKRIAVTPLIVLATVVFVLWGGIEFGKYLHALRVSLHYFKQNAYNYRNYPDVAIANAAAELCRIEGKEKTMFVAGCRNTIYILGGFDGPFFSYAPYVTGNTIFTAAGVVNDVIKFRPSIIVGWNYQDYFTGKTELSRFINDNYEVVRTFDLSLNHPYVINHPAILYKRRN